MSEQKKTRAEREDELRLLRNSPNGKNKLVVIFQKALGLRPGQMGPMGAPMIQAILDKEFPDDEQR